VQVFPVLLIVFFLSDVVLLLQPHRHCQVGDLLALMENGKLATFAVIDSIESCKLIGAARTGIDYAEHSCIYVSMAMKWCISHRKNLREVV
jgi:hypothetical protein